jgi:hypothetical protein
VAGVLVGWGFLRTRDTPARPEPVVA